MTFKTSKSDRERSELIIPLEKRAFGEFIAGLLGQRRSIERKFTNIRFVVNFAWLVNLHDIVEQRVFQNGGQLIDFSAAIYYADGRKIILTSLAGC